MSVEELVSYLGKNFDIHAGGLDLNGQNIFTTGDFTINNGTNSTFVNLAGQTIIVDGNANLNGQSHSLLNLNPVSPWGIDVAGALNANYATLKHSTAGVSTGIFDLNSINDGLNINWNTNAPSVTITSLVSALSNDSSILETKF